ncbi:MAG: PAS domain S-box protein [Winogradskyella sp.]|uniref:PAS domain S-box protein n=1 Tax=Winogradskyella sp. TaxID=1883156 RepID=UPI00184C1C0E|nr:PAS domain S-box protein [Winogradskyella sp.]
MDSDISTGLRLLKTITNKDSDIIITQFSMIDETFITMSDNCERILGYTRDEMEGFNYKDFTDNNFDALSTEEVKRNMEKPKGRYFTNIYVCKDGTKKIMLWVIEEIINNIALCFAIPIGQYILDSIIVLDNYIKEND